jgi:hypothetical protein
MQTYRILVDSQLDEGWGAWLGEMELTHLEDGTTLLIGPVQDQAALFGLLVKLRDLGVTLLSIEPTDAP